MIGPMVTSTVTACTDAGGSVISIGMFSSSNSSKLRSRFIILCSRSCSTRLLPSRM